MKRLFNRSGRILCSLFLISLALNLGFASCRQSRPPLESIPDDSLYQLESNWETQDGKQLHLKELSGPVQIVGLMFTRCKAICPTLVLDMKSIQKRVSWLHRRDVRFLLISIDPERDTPEKMKDYMGKMDLDTEAWTFVRGKPEDLTDLASLLGVKIAPLPDGGFSHTRIITVLGPDGRIKYQDANVAENASNFVDAAYAALK